MAVPGSASAGLGLLLLASGSASLPAALAPPLACLLAVPLLAWHARRARRSPRCRPVPGEVRERLRAIEARAKVPVAEVLVEAAGGERSPAPTARLLGLGRRSRTVVLAEGLLAGGPAGRVEAVFAHEIAHERRGHRGWAIVLLAGFVLLSFPLGLLAVRAAPAVSVPASIALLALAWRLAFGAVSRRFEREADADAADLVGREAVEDALEGEADPGGRTEARSAWLSSHPRLPERKAGLEALADPARRRRFEGQGRRLRAALTGFLGAALLLYLAAALGTWPAGT